MRDSTKSALFSRETLRWVSFASLALATALVLLLAGMFIGHGSGYFQAQSEGFASISKEDSERRVQECLTASGYDARMACVRDAIASGRDDVRSEEDLAAQQEMAKWAYWLLICTILQALVGGLGFVALIVTIRQGREANQIARDTAKTQLRAYLSGGGAVVSETTTHKGNCDQIVFKISNKGATPALLRKLTLRVWHVTNRQSQLVFARPVEASSSIAGSVDDITMPVILDLEDGSESLYLGAYETGSFLIELVIEYEDIFADNHAIAMLYCTAQSFWDDYPGEHQCSAYDQGTHLPRDILK